ncbi:ricin-type beta-trefoil lectin domain protein [Streptacidiphilus sp. PB12-B1b]|uniref:RICIN domain-containing protein n=1 Tax=Streptacidiphilus sp. PB12-B1b TaxID=2705012 RepID=UPI0015FD2239|nr:RICIN domain-containing protein [Streptacidiphilus sp. PB12-B1b]QMU77991.1 ricin-type beta-trefoil lectin domain protein [Streptacidiphilus sp. PB12-B1b]
MSIWTSLEPASTVVDPGSTTTVRLRVRNTSDVVDEYRFIPVGEIAPYVTIEPPTLRLYPGSTGTVELTFAPPRTPDATAGPNPYAVQIVPTEHPEATTVPEGNLTITAFTEIRAELVPHTVKGRFRGRPRLAIDNLGNTRLTASVSGVDNGDQLSYDVHPANVQIEPGRAGFVRTTLKPRRITWFGRKENRPYRMAVTRSGNTPVRVEGVFVQKGVLPGWLSGMLMLLLGLAVALVALWFAYQPHLTSLAQAQAQAAVSPLPDPTLTPAPAPAATAPAAPTPSAPAASAPPAATPAGGGSSGGQASTAPAAPQANRPPVHFTLMNNWTYQCADLPYYSAPTLNDPVTQYRCGYGSSDNQMWYLQQQGTAADGEPLYWIRNALGSNLCLDLPGYGTVSAGANVSTFTCTTPASNDNQLWEIPLVDSSGSGGLGVLIRNYKSGLCLDVSGWASNNSDKTQGVRLTAYPCSGSGWANHGFDDHLWNLMENPTLVYIPTRVGEIQVG